MSHGLDSSDWRRTTSRCTQLAADDTPGDRVSVLRRQLRTSPARHRPAGTPISRPEPRGRPPAGMSHGLDSSDWRRTTSRCTQLAADDTPGDRVSVLRRQLRTSPARHRPAGTTISRPEHPPARPPAGMSHGLDSSDWRRTTSRSTQLAADDTPGDRVSVLRRQLRTSPARHRPAGTTISRPEHPPARPPAGMSHGLDSSNWRRTTPRSTQLAADDTPGDRISVVRRQLRTSPADTSPARHQPGPTPARRTRAPRPGCR